MGVETVVVAMGGEKEGRFGVDGIDLALLERQVDETKGVAGAMARGVLGEIRRCWYDPKRGWHESIRSKK